MIFFQIVSGSVFVSTTIYLLYVVSIDALDHRPCNNKNQTNSCCFTFAVVWQLFISNICNYSIGPCQHCHGHANVLLFYGHHDETTGHREHNLRIEVVYFVSQITKILHAEHRCSATATVFYRIRHSAVLIANATSGNETCNIFKRMQSCIRYSFFQNIPTNSVSHLQILNTSFSFFLMFTNLPH